MKIAPLFLSALWLGPLLALADEVAVPQAFPADRYAKLIARSPFAPASDAAPVETPDFAQNLYITAIAKVGAQDCVFVASKDQVTKFALFGHEETNGVTLESIEWSPVVGKSRVILKKGGQVGTISYDETLIRAALPAGANANPGGEGVPPRAAGGGFINQAPRFERTTNGQGPNGAFQRRRTRIIGGGPQ